MHDDILARVVTGRATDAERRRVEDWCRESESNEQRLQAVARMLSWARDAETHRPQSTPPSVSVITAAAEVPSAEPLRPPDSGRGLARVALRWFPTSVPRTALVAAALVLIALGVSQWFDTGSEDSGFGVRQFRTGPGERATVVLTDGTVVRLAPESRLVLDEGSSVRNVSLFGRAYFAVAHDESSPFTVATGAGDLRVLGTRFVLDAAVEDLSLVVIEGRVALTGEGDEETVEVHGRQMAKLVKGTRLPVVEAEGPAAFAEWFGNFLAFQDTPLREAVQEIERAYGVTIEIVDPALGDRTITAWFAGWELPDVIEVVCTVATARCEIDGLAVRIESPSPSSPRSN